MQRTELAVSWCFKKQARLLPPAWPHRLQRIWSAFQTSARSLLTSSLNDINFFFSVFSLSLSHLQTHQVTYLDKFVSLLRSKWTLPPSTFTQDSGAPRLPAIVESRNLRPSWVGQAPVKAAPPQKKGPLETKAKFFPPQKKNTLPSSIFGPHEENMMRKISHEELVHDRKKRGLLLSLSKKTERLAPQSPHGWWPLLDANQVIEGHNFVTFACFYVCLYNISNTTQNDALYIYIRIYTGIYIYSGQIYKSWKYPKSQIDTPVFFGVKSPKGVFMLSLTPKSRYQGHDPGQWSYPIKMDLKIRVQELPGSSHSSMVQWKMLGYLKGNDPIGDPSILHWTMIMGGRVKSIFQKSLLGWSKHFEAPYFSTSCSTPFIEKRRPLTQISEEPPISSYQSLLGTNQMQLLYLSKALLPVWIIFHRPNPTA